MSFFHQDQDNITLFQMQPDAQSHTLEGEQLQRQINEARRSCLSTNSNGEGIIADEVIKEGKATDNRDCGINSRSPQKSQARQWELRYNELIKFKEENGHTMVPQKYFANQYLATWVTMQRSMFKQYKKGKYSAVAKQRIEKLNQIEFCWDAKRMISESKRDDELWKSRFNELKHYYCIHGNCNVPQGSKDDHSLFVLGTWVHTQRFQRKLKDEGKRSSMSSARIRLLDSLNFTWRAKRGPKRGNKVWNIRFQELKEFKRIHGHVKVPQKFPQVRFFFAEFPHSSNICQSLQHVCLFKESKISCLGETAEDKFTINGRK